MEIGRYGGDLKLTVISKAHVCVSTTAREASQLGYDVVLAEDAIGDRDIPGASGDEVTKVSSSPIARSLTYPSLDGNARTW